jgi:hypothetical protein
VADRLRAEGVDRRRRGKNRRAREESGELRTELTSGLSLTGWLSPVYTGPRVVFVASVR